MSYMPAIVSSQKIHGKRRLLHWAALSLALHGIVISWAILHFPARPTTTISHATIQVQLVAVAKPKAEQAKFRHQRQLPVETKPTPAPANEQGHRQSIAKNTPPPSIQQDRSNNVPASSPDEQLPLTFTRILHQAIDQQKHYPMAALRMHQQGTARVQFRLFEDGRVGDITLLKTSGYQTLDRSALLAVQNISPFTPARKFLHDDKQFFVDIVFRI